ncbi:serine hydrolase domain-containing protein [Roseateles asaccharophilus]|uniref:CubicO group peptidase (Beta-lactamase class C family) n=1 Tax=Roseateles asaccharophilus TaxID=582607 RepID=A0ABU2AFV2_9BURK|nr:serine hydrolase domain-containing protein [Roseateles asaccharophilus]MDR7336097.1 CubicO group peptidase (beta-lactamase class C family) [Roseateles asaccharophilus]
MSLLAVAAHAGTPATPAAMAAYADKLLDEQKIATDGPGFTVLVARGDQLLYKGARGAASIELGVPMQPDQIMRIGSVTKQFAAAALLKQIDDGKAKLDDPLSKYLPDYPNGAKITLLQLLNHTSGVKSYTGIPGYMANPIRRDLSTAELVKEFKDQPVDFQPGEKWAYNNSGYVLLGAVVETISGKSWHQSIDELLLRPAQITSVQFEAADKIFKGMARGYSVNGQREVTPAGLLSMTQPHAAGALIANTEGLWRWNQALHGGKLISKASYERMIAPEGPAKANHYGFGIATGKVRDHAMLSHGGGIHGFVSTLNYLPASQTTVVILRNSTGPGLAMDTVARKLAAFAIGEPFAEHKAVAVPADQLKAAEGLYARDGEKQTRTLRLKDGQLQSQRSGGGIAKLVPLGQDRFAFPDSLNELQLERGTDGKVVALKVFNNGESTGERWTLSGELPPERSYITLSPAQMQSLVGEYSSPQFGLKVFIDDKGRLMGQAPGQRSFELLASAPRQAHVPEVGAQLDFTPGEGPAASVSLTQNGQTLVMPRK